MSIFAYPSQVFEATVSGADTGLVGTIGVQVTDGEGEVIVPRTTAFLVEFPDGSGVYTARIVAPDEPGQYVLIWDTGSITPETTTAETLFVGATTTPLQPSAEGWLPSIGTVAALLRARTQDSDGNELGTFNDDTRPTGAEVLTFIALSAASLYSCAGAWLPATLWPMSQFTIAIGAGLLIEQSLFPEQINTDRSPYEKLKELYDELRVTLCNAATEYRPDDVPGPDEGEGGDVPLFYFGDGGLTLDQVSIEYDYATQRYIFRGEGLVYPWNT